jgi:hypothetical protein
MGAPASAAPAPPRARRRRARPGSLENREIQIRKRRHAVLLAEDSETTADRTRRQRRHGKPRQRRGANAGQARAGIARVDLRDQLGADTGPNFQSHIRMLPGETPGRGGQRVDRDLLDGAEPHNAGEPRRCQATATKAHRRPRSSIGIDRKLRLLKVPNIVTPLNVPSPFSGSFMAGVAPRLRPSGTPSAERLREGLPDS